VAQINQDRYETLAARALGVKGAGIFGHAEDAIFASLLVDANSPRELWYPQRIYTYGIGVVVNALAALRGGIQLRNTSLDQLWIIDHVNCSSGSGVAEWSLWVGEGITVDHYASDLLASNLDTRIPGDTVRDFGSQGTAAVVIPPNHGRIDVVQCPQNVPCDFDPKVVLSPGGSFIALNETANQKNRFGMYFHTRQAMPGELA